MNDEKLPIPQQENLLTLVIWDDSACKQIRAQVGLHLFSNRTYREILSRAYDYIDTYGRAPGDHVGDELDLEKPGEGDLLGSTLMQARSLKGSVNSTYVLDQLHKFVRQQALKNGIVEAHDLIQQGHLDEAEVALDKALKTRVEAFDPGLTLGGVVKVLKDKPEFRSPIDVGIKEIDKRGLGPARGEFHLLIAPPKRGKSWWLQHVTRRAITQQPRWRGAYITLELPKVLVGRRILQGLCSMTTRDIEKLPFTNFMFGDDGKLERFERVNRSRPNIATQESLNVVAERIEELHIEDRLRIQEFPMSQLTIHGLRSYLEMLGEREGFIPDFVALDYPDLMFVTNNLDNFRLALGNLYKELKGLAQERNLAMIAVTQGNRGTVNQKLLDESGVSEDFSKIGTVDCAITYSQTKVEREWGLARLFVANGRLEEDRFTTVITQSYATGQFALQSMPLSFSYEDILKEKGDSDDDE
jgi:replicative DNA helicase